ncbi:hypothetical protein GQ43DRAFT_213520 [Delitschia confertaspora ATCC 74209]|uniref:CCHC-type domain-containing protein n=1 Tax=Delitschia confertaspora ATCC 74209 TaxID=1513339 RepID=A0A9P4JIW7_9PLEO|nr:hypothetical protein GQ43DRAFT_213520 [Delitschia confertaspora ATCC 74209]
MKCRNCEAFGHISRDCPEPKNWNNVQCNNCKKMGHTKARCTEPAADDGYGDSSGVQGGGDSWGTADAGVGAQGGDNLDADVANTWGDAEADNSGW